MTEKTKFNAGDTIMKQGDEGHSAYIIESGVVEILLEKDNGLIQHIGTRGQGGIIGEMALVDNLPRTATIKAVENCTLLKIHKNNFDTRLAESDPIIKMVMQVILSRYRDMMTRAHILGSTSTQKASEVLELGIVKETNAIDELKLIEEIKRAIENDEFVLHFQPIFDIQKDKIAGLEALIRWNHPERGLVFPDEFIDVAENSGLITSISNIVVKKSCTFLQQVQKQIPHFNNIFMSVNFTAKDFMTPNFKNYILNNLQEYDISPNRFHIEITERLLMDEPTKAKEILQECRDSELLVSIDDFGTGYSSLSYLHYFPIDILKIDRSFITNIQHDPSSAKLVQSVIDLGHNIGMSIIAEGIEEEEQLSILKDMNCDEVQGYFYSKPLPEESCIEYMNKQFQ